MRSATSRWCAGWNRFRKSRRPRSNRVVASPANVQRALCGAAPLPFRYWDPGTMATIGRDRAVAMLFGVKLAGRLAWLFWLVAHIVFLAGFRNRATVFVNWIYHYLTYDLGLRAIVGRTRELPRGDAQRGDAERNPSRRGSDQQSSDAA